MRNAERGVERRAPDRRPVVYSAFRTPHSALDHSMPEDLAAIYRTTYRALVRFLYRKVWDAERAEDLAQEAFARAVVHKPDNARGWLFIVAANMARDDARRAARERRHPGPRARTAAAASRKSGRCSRAPPSCWRWPHPPTASCRRSEPGT